MKDEDIVKMEILNFIQSNALMIAETKRIWESKEDLSEYERGRKDGIIIVGMDFQDNFIRFADRIGIDLKKKKELSGGKE